MGVANDRRGGCGGARGRGRLAWRGRRCQRPRAPGVVAMRSPALPGGLAGRPPGRQGGKAASGSTFDPAGGTRRCNRGPDSTPGRFSGTAIWRIGPGFHVRLPRARRWPHSTSDSDLRTRAAFHVRLRLAHRGRIPCSAPPRTPAPRIPRPTPTCAPGPDSTSGSSRHADWRPIGRSRRCVHGPYPLTRN